MTLNDLATADLMVSNHGTVVMLHAMSRDGAAWLHENVSSEPWQWVGNAIACEPRMVQDVLDGAMDDGLKVAA